MDRREVLKRGGLRAYELGRLRSAMRAAWLLVPVALVCTLETRAVDSASSEPCLCIGVLLLGTAVFFRWRSREGAESVRDGLLAGALPLLTGLLLGRIGSPDAPLISLSTAACAVLGLLSGLWLGQRSARRQVRLTSWLTAALVSALAASLGCIALGVPALAAVTLGLFVGATVSFKFTARGSTKN